MPGNLPPANPEILNFGDAAVARARRWTEEARAYPISRAALLLSRVLKDPAGLQYTVDFVDGVVRPEDTEVAAFNLAKLGRQNPRFLPWYLRIPARLGGALAPVMPALVVPAARRVFGALVGDLVLDVSPRKLGKAIERVRAGSDARLNMNLLGEAVLGDQEAGRRLAETRKLLERPDVDYVSLKVSAVTGPHNPWAFDEVVERAVRTLLPVYQVAVAHPEPKFINLDMEEYRDLWLTIEVFTKLLDRTELRNYEAGIVLQTYLPDCLEALVHLEEWAAKRVAAGGAPIKVRVVKGANLAMERVDAKIHGWPLTTQPSKQATDANYLRVLDYALDPERIKNVRIGVAGHNLFTLALALELAESRAITSGVEVEMLAGMATAEATAIAKDVGQLLLYVPVVRPEEFDVAIAYLVRRLEENSASENFMSAIFDLDEAEMFNRERDRFLAALADAAEIFCGANRTQNRATESDEEIAAPVRDGAGAWHFANTPDSDPALPANQEWARQIVKRMPATKLGEETSAAARVDEAKQLDQIMRDTAAAGAKWGQRPAAERAEILRQAGVALGRRRADLMEIAGAEAGKTLDQADVEVSEAIDFAHYYAERALELETISGASFAPHQLTVVTPPWNFPLAIPTGSVLAALAAGSAVVFKPARLAKRCGAVIAETLWEAGVPRELLALVDVPSRDLGKDLITHECVDQVILTGGAPTAELFRSWKPDLKLFAETSGKNAIIVTPSADLDLAVKDVVQSAFGHAGQKCSAASLVILVGSVAQSKRFHNQLIDAVKSLVVGYPTDLATQMGPVVETPGAKLRSGLTELGEGERWNLRPEQLDDTGKLWSPGVRSGVQPGSAYHLTEYFGPILGVITAADLPEAVEIQNAVDFGLTAGLHSLDPDEIRFWLGAVEAGNVYVNRGITGAIVRRQPFGGWKRSAVGSGTKAGGPSYLLALGGWQDAPPAADGKPVPLRKKALQSLRDLGQEVLSPADAQWLAEALAADQQAADQEFDLLHDPSALGGVERNILRYLPTDGVIRLSEDGSLRDLLRVVGAALALGEVVTVPLVDELQYTFRELSGGFEEVPFYGVSVGQEVPDAVAEFLLAHGMELQHASDGEWLTEVARTAWGLGGRIRLIGGNREALGAALEGSIDVAVWSGPITRAGRIEILPFVHEQAIAMTDHRFGNRTPLGERVFGD